MTGELGIKLSDPVRRIFKENTEFFIKFDHRFSSTRSRLQLLAFKKIKKIISKFSIANGPDRFLESENRRPNYIQKKSRLNGVYLMLITDPFNLLSSATVLMRIYLK